MALAAALVAACGSGLASNAEVHVTGRALREDGSPAAGLAVVLVRRPMAGDAVPPDRYGDLLSLACLSPAPPSACGAAPRATTGADGRFDLAMRGADVQPDGTPADLDLSVADATAAPSTSLRLRVEKERTELGDLVLWTGAAGDRTSTAYETSAGVRVWEAPAPGLVDPRLLEDAAGLAHPVRRPSASAVQRGAPSPFAAGPRPPSRGLPCRGAAAMVAPCPATDGDFESPLRLASAVVSCAAPGGGSGSGCGAGSGEGWVELDLGAARSLALVVVRGAPVPFFLQLSVDGMPFDPAGEGPAGDSAFTIAAAPARHLRLQPTRGSMTGLRELSVW